MVIHPADRHVVKWAIDHARPYEYVREYGLPDNSLRVELGVSRAYFKSGQLVHWRASVNGEHFDQLMFELATLVRLCTALQGYPPQQIHLSLPEQSLLAGRDSDN